MTGHRDVDAIERIAGPALASGRGGPAAAGRVGWSHAECVEVERLYGSPFYGLDRDAFVANYRALEAAFGARHDAVQIAYSYKTNYLPYLCGLVRDLGGAAEVVSRLEYDLALRIGQDPARIIFNGPLKRPEDLELALRRGSLVHVDARAELEHVRAFAERHPGAPLRLGLRVNMDLADEQGVSHVQGGLPVSRFGLTPELLRELAPVLARSKLAVRSLHGHTSSSTRSPWVYGRIVETLCRVAEELFPGTVEDVNVGGGFFGRMPPGFAPPGAVGFDAYAEVIARSLAQSAWARRRRPRLVLEPGVALVANALSFFTRVVDVKEIRGSVLAVVDGSVLNVKPSMHPRNQPHAVLAPAGGARPPARLLSVTGSTCLEHDYLLRDVVCSLAPGDFVRIDHAGAYTVVMTPPFIHPAPAVVVREAGRAVPIRTRQTLQQMFAAHVP